jgi:hypothetical protein
MWGEAVRRRSYAWLGLLVVAVLGAGCSPDPVEPGATDGCGQGGVPEYCTGPSGADTAFWEVVHQSCRGARDGDVDQADALRTALDELPAEEVADFHRTFVRLNKALGPASTVADDSCAPGLGLGRDLGTDYRSWLIAHGQAVYEAVLAAPQSLRDLPDAEAGCGLGEPFGDTAREVYVEMTGADAADSGLPVLED